MVPGVALSIPWGDLEIMSSYFCFKFVHRSHHGFLGFHIVAKRYVDIGIPIDSLNHFIGTSSLYRFVPRSTACGMPLMPER